MISTSFLRSRGRFLMWSSRAAVAAVRWVTIALLLVLALADPVPGWAGLPAWVFVLLFAAYSVVTDLLRHRWDSFRARPQVAATLDLVVAGGLYLLGGEHDGPLYALFFLAVVNAAATLGPRAALLYAAAAAAVITIAELTLREGSPTDEVILDIGERTIILALVVAGTALLVRRLTIEREAVRAAHDEAERLAELERLRGNFVAAVSHDLQTPLTAVRAGLGLLESSASDRLRPDEHQLLSNARRNAERLGLQINDLLTHNQIEADMLQLDCAPFDFRQVIADTVAVAHPLVEQKGQELHVDVAEPLPTTGDQRRLGQALTNLVVNAHRHTPRGTRIAIVGRTTPDGLLVQVTDDGPGIPAEARELIFQRFARLNAGTSGSGLGLTIAKAVIERHGGHLGLEPETDRGASFSLVLPLRHQEEQGAADDADRR